MSTGYLAIYELTFTYYMHVYKRLRMFVHARVYVLE